MYSLNRLLYRLKHVAGLSRLPAAILRTVMDNLGSTSTPLSDGFKFFPELPADLQNQIWMHAAVDWIELWLCYLEIWTVNDKTIFLFHLDTVLHKNSSTNFLDEYLIEFPPLFYVCAASRSIMYNAMLGFQSDDPVPREENVQMFLKGTGSQPNTFRAFQIYGWRIQDFRYPGLERRVKAEKERLKEMTDEIREIREKIRMHQSGKMEFVVGHDNADVIRLKPDQRVT